MDFWLGEWDVDWTMSDGRSGHGENTIVKDLNGCVVTERYQDITTPFAGTSLFGYSTYRKQWNQVWIDNSGLSFQTSGGPTSEGSISFVLNVKHFAGQPFSRIVFDAVQKDSLIWRFQTRSAETDSWMDATVSYYRRKL
jgi:hypothetical protein